MEFKFLMSRHAQSTHNICKNQARSSSNSNQSNYKETEKYKKIKYDPKLIDLKNIDQEQVIQSKNMYGIQTVGIILVSPLNRCLQTAIKLAEGHQNIQIIVQPLLTSRVSSAWSVGKSLKQKTIQNPNLNFSFAEQQQKNWCFDLLDKNTKSKYNKSDYTPESILQFISEGHPQHYQNIMSRAIKLKAKLKKSYLQKSGTKKILIISHSCTLKTILASQINKKGKAVSHIEFNHCLPIYIRQDYLMNGTILNAQQKYSKKQGNKHD